MNGSVYYAPSRPENATSDDGTSTTSRSPTESPSSHGFHYPIPSRPRLETPPPYLLMSNPTRTFEGTGFGESYHSENSRLYRNMPDLWAWSPSITDSPTTSRVSLLGRPSPSISPDVLPPCNLIPHDTHDDRLTSLRSIDAIPGTLRVKRQHRDETKKSGLRFWDRLPDEVRLHIFSFLPPKELFRVSRVSKSFRAFCFDGQLWASLDATGFYQEIPASTLATLIESTGPFLKHLNLRGCVQLEHRRKTEAIAKSCKHLVSTTLEGCRNFEKNSLHTLLRGNEHLTHLNLAGLLTLSNSACPIIARSCPNLKVLNVSWCQRLEAGCLMEIVDSCTKLRDLRASEVRGFDCTHVAESIFKANKLERLVLSGCLDLNDSCLSIMMLGVEPETDMPTGLYVVPPRKLRHLDLSRCVRLTDRGVKYISHVTPNLQGLQLSKCALLTNAALKPIFATTPELTHLELDELEDITDELFSEHLAKAPCAGRLEHLSLSYCDSIGDEGLVPIMKRCVRLKSAYFDNTKISDALLTQAASMVQTRSTRTQDPDCRPRETLHLAVFDCPEVTWTGVLEVMSRNAEVWHPAPNAEPATYPTEVVSLKCFYGHQMVVNEHQKRVLRGDLPAARKLARKWIEHMREEEEARARGGPRRRRRRGLDAQQQQEGAEATGSLVLALQRARPPPTCSVM